LPIRSIVTGETALSLFKGAPRFVEFLRRKWTRELEYGLIKELWAFT
jgi:nuclear transport factor 2 (NTF2) superfamily protein